MRWISKWLPNQNSFFLWLPKLGKPNKLLRRSPLALSACLLDAEQQRRKDLLPPEKRRLLHERQQKSQPKNAPKSPA